jgi:hypothetical protein
VFTRTPDGAVESAGTLWEAPYGDLRVAVIMGRKEKKPMVKRSSALVVLSLAWMLSQTAFAQEAEKIPLFSSECEASQAPVTPASVEASPLPALPGITPEPTERATYICGSCSQAPCLGLLSDDECTIETSQGTYFGRCVVSTAWTCPAAPRKYCACM